MAGLAAFMDRYATDDFDRPVFRGAPRRSAFGLPLADAGPSSARIAQAAGTPQLGEQLLATLFWWCYLRSDALLEAVPEMRGHNLNEFPPILASHAQGTRFDLLILVPGLTAPVGRRVTPVRSAGGSGNAGSSRGISAVALQESDRMAAILARADVAVNPRVAVLAVAELAADGDFHVVVAAPPEETRTAAALSPEHRARSFVVPTPAVPVTIDDDPRPVATAGVIAAVDGGTLVTTARHVIEIAAARSAKIKVGGLPASVVGEPDQLTDSCVLAVGCPARPGAGAAGPLRTPPVLWMPAGFAGAASGRKQTRIISFDMSVVSPTPYSGGRVYTDPDTIPGDSGAALIDPDDHIVGFAVGRTAIGARVEFSTWSWADQVLSAHELADPGDEQLYDQ
jgi:hypothetical protein